MLLALASACGGGRFSFGVPAAPDETVFVAIADESGTVIRTDRLDSAPIELEAGGPRAVAFVFGPGELVSLDGNALSEGELEEVTLGIGSALGGCSSCLLPSDEAPMVLQPGESCRPPRFARVEASRDADVESVRAQVRLSMAGPCPCTDSPPGTAVPLPVQVRPVPPSDWPYNQFAISGTSTIGIFSEHFMATLDLHGTRIASVSGPSVFEGAPLGVAGLDDGFAVMTHDAHAGESHTRVSILDTRLESRGTAPFPLRVEAVARHTPQGFIAAGEGTGVEPGLETCRFVNGNVECVSLFPSSIVGGHRFSDLHREDDGLLLAALGEDTLILESLPPSGEPIELTLVGKESERSYGEIIGPNGFRSRWMFAKDPKAGDSVDSIAVSDGFLHLCSAERGEITFLAAEIPPPDENLLLDFRVVAQMPGATCGRIARVDRSEFRLDSGAVVSCRRDGCETRLEPALEPYRPILNRSVGEIEVLRGGQSLLIAEPFGPRTIFGPAARIPQGRALTARGAVAYAFSESVLQLIDAESLQMTQHAFGIAGTPSAAALDSRLDEVVVAGYEAHDQCLVPWLARVHPVTLEARKIDLPESVVRSCAPILDLAEAAPGRMLVVSEDRILMGLVGDETFEVDLGWDDPSTSMEEERPNVTAECTVRAGRRPSYFVAPERRSFLDADGNSGSAFVVGCQAIVFRVRPFGPRWSATRVNLSARADGSIEGLEDDTRISAVAALCPNRVALAREGYGSNALERHIGVIWHLDDESLTKNSVNVRAFSSTRLDSGPPTALLGPADALTVIFGGAVHRVGSNRQFRLDNDTLNLSAKLEGGRFVSVGNDGAYVGGQE